MNIVAAFIALPIAVGNYMLLRIAYKKVFAGDRTGVLLFPVSFLILFGALVGIAFWNHNLLVWFGVSLGVGTTLAAVVGAVVERVTNKKNPK